MFNKRRIQMLEMKIDEIEKAITQLNLHIKSIEDTNNSTGFKIESINKDLQVVHESVQEITIDIANVKQAKAKKVSNNGKKQETA